MSLLIFTWLYVAYDLRRYYRGWIEAYSGPDSNRQSPTNSQQATDFLEVRASRACLPNHAAAVQMDYTA